MGLLAVPPPSMDFTAPGNVDTFYQPALEPILEEEATEEPEASRNDEPDAKRQRISHDCDLCGKTYKHKKSLLVHLRSPAHCRRAGLIVPDLSCSLCPDLDPFAREDNLQRHMKEIHGGIKRSNPRQTAATQPLLEHDRVSDSLANAQHESIGASEDMSSSSLLSTSSECSVIPSNITTPLQPTTTTTPATTDASPTNRPPQDMDEDMSASDEAVIHEAAIIDEQNLSESASMESEDTTDSLKSTFSARLPFRNEIVPDIRSRIPPSMPRHFVKPCPLCGKELGKTMDDGQKVKNHLDLHLQEMTNPQWEIECLECEVSFVHAKDLEWHLKCVKANGNCGFCQESDLSTACKGHHPPSSNPEWEKRHQQLLTKLRHWENVQLQDYKKYVDDYFNGSIPTNAPPAKMQPATGPFQGRPAFRRSTGSLFSIRTCSTDRTARSAPGDSLSQSPRLTKSVKRLSIRFYTMSPSAAEKAVFKAIEQRDQVRLRELIQKRPEISFETALIRAVNQGFALGVGTIIDVRPDIPLEAALLRALELFQTFGTFEAARWSICTSSQQELPGTWDPTTFITLLQRIPGTASAAIHKALGRTIRQEIESGPSFQFYDLLYDLNPNLAINCYHEGLEISRMHLGPHIDVEYALLTATDSATVDSILASEPWSKIYAALAKAIDRDDYMSCPLLDLATKKTNALIRAQISKELAGADFRLARRYINLRPKICERPVAEALTQAMSIKDYGRAGCLIDLGYEQSLKVVVDSLPPTFTLADHHRVHKLLNFKIEVSCTMLSRALRRAVELQKPACIRWLLEIEPKLNATASQAALVQAIRDDDVATTLDLIDVSSKNSRQVAFNRAVDFGNYSMARLLLRFEPFPRYIPSLETSSSLGAKHAIDEACKAGDMHMLQILIGSDRKVANFDLACRAVMTAVEEVPHLAKELLQIAFKLVPLEHGPRVDLRDCGEKCFYKLLVRSFTTNDHDQYELVLRFGRQCLPYETLENTICEALNEKQLADNIRCYPDGVVTFMSMTIGDGLRTTPPDAHVFAMLLPWLDIPAVLDGVLRSEYLPIRGYSMKCLLSAASFRGYFDIVKRLLDAGVNPNPLDKGAEDDVSASCEYALSLAVYGGYSEIVKLLLSAGAQLLEGSMCLPAVPESIMDLIRNHARKQVSDSGQLSSDEELLKAGGVLVSREVAVNNTMQSPI